MAISKIGQAPSTATVPPGALGAVTSSGQAPVPVSAGLDTQGGPAPVAAPAGVVLDHGVTAGAAVGPEVVALMAQLAGAAGQVKGDVALEGDLDFALPSFEAAMPLQVLGAAADQLKAIAGDPEHRLFEQALTGLAAYALSGHKQLEQQASTLFGSDRAGAVTALGQTFGAFKIGNQQVAQQQFLAEMQNRYPDGAPIDPNALVQWVLREAYIEQLEDLRFFAEKVKYFNFQKKLVRDYVQKLRKFQADMRTAQGLAGYLPPPQQGDPKYLEYLQWAATYMVQHQYPVGGSDMTIKAQAALDAMSQMQTIIEDKAFDQSVEEVMARAEQLLQERFGVKIPDEIRTMIHEAFTSKDPAKLHTAMSAYAAYVSYLSDCSCDTSGRFKGAPGYNGPSNGCNDAQHLGGGHGSPSYEDFLYYLGPDAALYGLPVRYPDSPNKTARGNLAQGDISLIEQAFGFNAGQLGITGGSSVVTVVNAAMSPLGDRWKNEILIGKEKSTKEIYNDLLTNGPESAWAEQFFGKELVDSLRAFTAEMGGTSYEAQAWRDLGLPTTIPPSTVINQVNAGVDPNTALEDEIKKWDEKLSAIGDDAQLANVDLQNQLQKQQQLIQMLSNVSKMLHDTAVAVIRKIG